MKFACPHCARSLEVETIHTGVTVPCPLCGKPLTVPPSVAGEPAAGTVVTDGSEPRPGPAPAATDALEHTPPRRYKVGGLLAKGGMGAILDARDTAL